MFETAHLHPMIVHFPIALIITGFAADVFSFFIRSEKCLSKAGFYLMVAGTLGVVAAWLSGQIFTNEPTQGEIVKIFSKHETGAFVTLIIMVTGASFRTWLVVRKNEEVVMKWIALTLYFLGFAAVSYTGFMGGTMVYSYMMSL